jgi:DNA invertase Pin-like site-specific DNA recombinase
MFVLMAEYEAALIQERTVARLAAARARGRTGGRKPKMTAALVDKAQPMYDSRQFTMAEIAASCRVTAMTIYRNIRTDRVVGFLLATLRLPKTRPCRSGAMLISTRRNLTVLGWR